MVASETYDALVETLYQARLENCRLRISQLRRIRECAMDRRGFAICYLSTRDAIRWDRFIDAVEKEIARLRGEG